MDTALTVQRYEADEGWWEICTGSPVAALRPWITSYQGYAECAPGLLRRRHLPSNDVVLIIGFEQPLQFTSGDGRLQAAPRTSFLGALADTYVVSEWSGVSAGIEVDLTPPGARMLLGRPMHELAGDVIALEDLFGPAAPLLAERLESQTDWARRFEILDDLFLRQFARSTLPSAGIRYAWEQIVSRHGDLEVGALAAEVGWSRRHLAERFREEVGLTPKTMARVVRFNRALSMIQGRDAPRWSAVAAEAGYYDQAHLVRDFRQFTGYPPTEFARRRIAGMLDVLD